jgi:hypothetical protein
MVDVTEQHLGKSFAIIGGVVPPKPAEPPDQPATPAAKP